MKPQIKRNLKNKKTLVQIYSKKFAAHKKVTTKVDFQALFFPMDRCEKVIKEQEN